MHSGEGESFVLKIRANRLMISCESLSAIDLVGIVNAFTRADTVESGHLWIQDGERIVCTHCGITLKKGAGDECQTD